MVNNSTNSIKTTNHNSPLLKQLKLNTERACRMVLKIQILAWDIDANVAVYSG